MNYDTFLAAAASGLAKAKAALEDLTKLEKYIQDDDLRDSLGEHLENLESAIGDVEQFLDADIEKEHIGSATLPPDEDPEDDELEHKGKIEPLDD